MYIIYRWAVIFAVFLQSTSIAYTLYDVTGREILLGFLGLAEVISLVLFSLNSGPFVDRNDKRSVLIWSIVAFALITVLFLYAHSPGLAIYDSNINLYLGVVYFGFFLNGIARAYVGPASFSLLSRVVKKENYDKAIPLSTTAFMIGLVTGPLAGGLLLAYVGIFGTLIVSLVVLLVAGLLVFFFIGAKPPLEEHKSDKVGTIAQLKEGIEFVKNHPIILGALTLDMFAVLFGGAESLLPVFAKDILAVGEVGYGWLRSAHGIGSIIMLFLLYKMPIRSGMGKKMLISVFLFGVCIIIFGLSKSVYLSFIVLFLAGVFDAVSVLVRQHILQTQTPEALKGRVSSVNSVFVSSSNELGAFESGFTAELMGTIPAVLFGGSMTIAIVVILSIKFMSLRRYSY